MGILERSLLIICLILSQTACNIQATLTDISPTIISGKIILPESQFSTGILKTLGSYIGLGCPANVTLYRGDNPAALQTVSVSSDGTYAFTISEADRDSLKNGSLQYKAVMSNCDSSFSRPLTGMTNQNISLGSELTDQALAVAAFHGISKSSIKKAALENFVARLQMIESEYGLPSLEGTYLEIKNSPALSSEFLTVFGFNVEKVEDITPEIKKMTVPSSFDEGQTLAPTVETQHWSSNYLTIYKWELDGQVLSHTSAPSFSKVLSANFQGSHNVKITLGRDDGAGNVDTTKPTWTRTFTVQVANTIPPASPTFTKVTPTGAFINSANVAMNLNTGASLVNCESFSSLALTENAAIAPTNESAYSITCNTTGTQTLNHTLVSEDGPITLKLWALDASKTISTAPTQVTFTLDRQAPAVSLTALSSANLQGNSLVDLTYSATDTYGIASLTLQIAEDGNTFTDVATLAASATSYQWRVPTLDASGVKIRLVAIDNAGNTNTSTSATFNVSSTAPNPPVLSLNTATPSQSTTVSLNNQNCNKAASQIIFTESMVAPSLSDNRWQTCTAGGNYNYTIPATQGIHNIYGWLRDLAGNISSYSLVEFTHDTVVPSVTLTSLNSGLYKGGTTQTISWTASDAGGLSSSPISLEYSTNNGGSWISISSGLSNSGAYLWTVPSIDSNTVKVRVTATDKVGLTSSSVSSGSLTIDSTIPTLSLTNLPTTIKGATPFNLQFSASDTNNISSLTLQFAQDGITFTDIATPAAGSNSYLWTPPAVNTAGSKVRLIAVDMAGNSSTITSAAFGIDSNAPTLSLTSLNSGSYKGSSIQTIIWNAADDVGLNNGAISLDYSADNGLTWNAISNALNNATNDACVVPGGSSGCYSWTLPLINSNQVRVRAKATDSSGNVSTVASSAALVIDSAAPTISLNNFNFGIFKAGSSESIAWSSSDNFALAGSPVAIEYSSNNGSTWTTLSSGTINGSSGGCSIPGGSSGCYAWTLPALDSSTMLVRLTAYDAVGNFSQALSTLAFTVDNTAPAVNLTSMNSGAYLGGSIQSINWNSSDNISLPGSPVSIDYTTDGGTTWTSIATAQSASGTYAWTIPSSINSVQVKVRISATDSAGWSNSAASSSNLTVDSTAPGSLVLTRTSNAYSNTNSISMNIAGCTGDAVKMLFSESTSVPLASDPNWTTCAASKVFTTSTGDGLKSIYAFAMDAVGNISSVSTAATFTLDTVAPAITFSSGAIFPGNSSASFTWLLTDQNTSSSQNFTVELASDGSNYVTQPAVAAANGPLSNRPFNTSLNLPNVSQAGAKVRVSFTDLAGNSASAVWTFKIDNSKPTISSFNLNNGTANTSNNNVQISLNAADSFSKVNRVCFLSSSIGTPATPANNASCWTTLATGLQSQTVSITPADGIYYLLGFTKQSYTVYVWVMDEAGNISVNGGSDGVDKKSIYFDPGTPPVVKDVIAANVDVPSSPPLKSQLKTNVSQKTIYVRWNASDLEGLAANPISLSYTTDEVNFIDITGAQNLPNAINGGCTNQDSSTGCYTWTNAPTSGYFSIRVTVKDMLGLKTFARSSGFNDDSLQIIAGNIGSGLKGSAMGYTFRTGNQTSGYTLDSGGLIFADDGRVFVRDQIDGLLWINPATGVIDKFIPTTGTSTGDGGQATSATLKYPEAMRLDYNNGLLIWDSDRIRRVDLNTNIITTILGGGASTDPAGTQVDWNQIKLAAYDDSTVGWTVLPNGDMYFRASGSGNGIFQHYVAATQKVERIQTQGPGFDTNASAPWTPQDGLTRYPRAIHVKFNPTTSAVEHMLAMIYYQVIGNDQQSYARLDFLNGSHNQNYSTMAPYDIAFPYHPWLLTGMDGKFYVVAHDRSGLYSWDADTNSLTLLLGTTSGSRAICPDGTPKTSCAIMLNDVFISKTGQIFFMEKGLIRTVDSDDKILTVFGQGITSGDGDRSTNARISSLMDLEFGKNNGGARDRFYIIDWGNYSIREFQLGGSIRYIGYGGLYNFASDTGSGDIFWGNQGGLYRLDYNTLASTLVAGGGGTAFTTAADGTNGASISFTAGASIAYNGQVLAWDGKDVLQHKSRWNSGTVDAMLKIYDSSSSYKQYHVAGVTGANGAFPATTTPAATAYLPAYGGLSGAYPSTANSWLLTPFSSTIYTVTRGGDISPYKNFPRSMTGFAWDNKVHDATRERFFYCNSNKLYQYDMKTDSESQLSWSQPGLSCVGSTRRLLYHPERNSVIFAVYSSGFYGVAEYFLPD
ncbi:beta strand repeat-containing protein [Bdellovibrio bacteriovorus]|uniref:beta strand repeat-containing protein n=1 Tax=Bdellovibrio bacteriovorus TaxID=959 RepID=UPI0035A66716